jgi:hypothetical protein
MPIDFRGKDSPPDVICDPSGTAGGNTFTSFAAANAARIAAGPGARLLIGGTVTAEAVEYDFTNLSLGGLGGGVPVLTFPAGATAVWTPGRPPDFEVLGVGIVWAGSAPFITVPADGLYVLLDQYASISTDPGASGAFIRSTVVMGVQIDVGVGCSLNGAAGRPIIDLDVGGPFASLFFARRSTLSQDALTGGDAFAFSIVNEAAGLTAVSAAPAISQTQTGTTTPVFDPP